MSNTNTGLFSKLLPGNNKNKTIRTIHMDSDTGNAR